jgi:hypothetical protein
MRPVQRSAPMRRALCHNYINAAVGVTQRLIEDKSSAKELDLYCLWERQR